MWNCNESSLRSPGQDRVFRRFVLSGVYLRPRIFTSFTNSLLWHEDSNQQVWHSLARVQLCIHCSATKKVA